MSWTINDIPIEQIGEVEWEVGNQTDGVLEIIRAANADSPVLFPHGTAVVVKDDDGVVRFRGRIRDPRNASESAGARRQAPTADDAWARLGRKIWEAPYEFGEGTDTRVVIGGKLEEVDISDPIADPPEDRRVLDLKPVNCRQTIEEIAEAADYDEEHRDIDVSGKIPPQRADGITLKQGLQAVLKWFPGSVAWVSPADEVLHVRKASGLPELNVPLSAIEAGFQIRERADLVVPGVRLICRKRINSNVCPEGPETRTEYTAGDPTSDGAIVEPLDLAPEVNQLVVANIRVLTRAEMAAQVETADFWKHKIPWVASAYESETLGISLKDAFFAAGDFTGPRVIVAGSIPERFYVNGCEGPFDPRDKIVTADNSITPTDFFGPAVAYAFFNYSDPKFPRTRYKPASLTFRTTDLYSGRYAWQDPVASDPGEDPADFSHLPQQLMDETARLGWEGMLSFVSDELPRLEQVMGHALNITGSENAAWATMRTPIARVRQNPHTRRTWITFGASAGYSLRDLVDLLRARRHQAPERIRYTPDGGIPPLPEGGAEVPAGEDEQTETEVPVDIEVPTTKLSVEITPPEAVEAGARYHVRVEALDGSIFESGPHESEAEVELPLGVATIWFEHATGWRAPGAIEDYILQNVSHEIDGGDAEYTELDNGPRCPFRVTVDNEAGTATVHSEGSTLKEYGAGKKTITGLDSPFSVSAGTKIWAEYDLSTEVLSIAHGSTWWTGHDAPVEVDDITEEQTMAFIEIAEIYAEGETLRRRQLLQNALKLVERFYDGAICTFLEESATAAS